jgi:hypothetical protein
MVLQRLNSDSSWLISTAQGHLVLDPWLQGAQSNGPAWFNTQWLPNYAPGYQALPQDFSVFVAFPFSDHFHVETLRQLQSKGAHKIVLGFKSTKSFPNQMPEKGNIGPFYFEKVGRHFLHSGWVIQAEEKRLFYTPHGFNAKKSKVPENIDMWIAALGGYTLPFWLGGEIALGFKHHQQTLSTLNPRFFTRTHDVQKPGAGLVSRWGRSEQPTDHQWNHVQKDPRFIPLSAGERFQIL